MKIAISKKSLTGKKGYDFGYQYDDDGKFAKAYHLSAGKLKLIDTSKLHKQIEVEEPVSEDEVQPATAKTKAAVKAVKKVQVTVVDEELLKKLSPALESIPLVAPIDPGFVDPANFGQPRALGRLRFASIDENSPTVQKLRALGVTDDRLREGFLLHDPKSFPALEVTVI